MLNKIKKKVRQLQNGIKKSEIQKWQDRFEKNKTEYENNLSAMTLRDNMYNGSDKIMKKDGTYAADSKYTRNIVAEIIEAEVDSSIPLPKVSAKRLEDEENAQTIENFLRNETDFLPFERLNDLDERTTPIQGGNYYLVEWDNTRNTHKTVGGVKVSLLHPRQVIPQAGVTEIEDMDYIFVMIGVTKEQVKRKFGVDVSYESEEFPQARSNAGETQRTADDMVTLVTAYYKNSKGGIGVYRWVGDTEVQNLNDYFARRLKRCKKCGEVVSEDDTKCKHCGSTKFEYAEEKTTPLTRDIELGSGEMLNQMLGAEYQDGIKFDENGEMIFDEMGNPVTEQIMIADARPNDVPVYKIKQYPIVLRRNISKNNSLLGISDVDTLKDPQEFIKKVGSKIQEKILKGGSYVTFPKGANIRKTDEELNVIELDSITDKQMIDVINIQPNINNDVMYQESVYQSARQLIGITDSFQGRSDRTAQSGAAKQFAAAQAAGRLESKRTMKQAAYQELYELIFKFMLAFADEPRPTTSRSGLGEIEYGIFDRYNFLERDANGELYWNDDFLFSVDTTSNLAQNREALWQSARDNWQSGAFGDPKNIKSRIMYWSLLEKYHFPGAGSTKNELLNELKEQQTNGGDLNAMPNMQIGNVDQQGTVPAEQQIPAGLQMPQQSMQQL